MNAKTEKGPAVVQPGLAPASVLVHAGRPPSGPGEPVNPPLVLSSTYHQGGELSYGREGNTTWAALEEVLGLLEGGSCLTFASGMAAIAAIIECLPVPGQVVVAGDAYSGTRRLLADLAGRGRLECLQADVSDTEATLAVCARAHQAGVSAGGGGFGAGGVLWIESPTNPLLAIADIASLVEGAHRLGMEVVVDNTFATPLLQHPLELGADVVVHSASKFIAGHSDLLLGATVSRREDIAAALTERRTLHGAIPGPFEAWLALRGVRTLAVRLERAQENAAELARRLADHPAVERVLYPGLPDHPGHQLAAEQMRGFGAMISFEVAAPRRTGGAPSGAPSSVSPSAVAAEKVVEAAKLATAGTSLGGVETLLERRGRWAGESHLPPGLIRLSVGIEDVEDLWVDLDRALATVLDGAVW